jgi:hypothetical protein
MESGVITRRVSFEKSHTSFNSTTFDNDISLLKLNVPLSVYTKQISPVCISPNDRDYSTGTWRAIASGYIDKKYQKLTDFKTEKKNLLKFKNNKFFNTA